MKDYILVVKRDFYALGEQYSALAATSGHTIPIPIRHGKRENKKLFDKILCVDWQHYFHTKFSQWIQQK